jgi:hypothetical protein
MPTLILSSECPCAGPEMQVLMIWINQLRSAPAQPCVAQPHR